MLLALITTVDRNVNFYTIGEPDDRDVRVAANVARELALPYEVWPPAASGATVDLRALVEAFIDRTDGLVPLVQIRDMVDQLDTPPRLGVKLHGSGGEAAGGRYGVDDERGPGSWATPLPASA